MDQSSDSASVPLHEGEVSSNLSPAPAAADGATPLTPTTTPAVAPPSILFRLPSMVTFWDYTGGRGVRSGDSNSRHRWTYREAAEVWKKSLEQRSSLMDAPTGATEGNDGDAAALVGGPVAGMAQGSNGQAQETGLDFGLGWEGADSGLPSAPEAVPPPNYFGAVFPADVPSAPSIPSAYYQIALGMPANAPATHQAPVMAARYGHAVPDNMPPNTFARGQPPPPTPDIFTGDPCRTLLYRMQERLQRNMHGPPTPSHAPPPTTYINPALPTGPYGAAAPWGSNSAPAPGARRARGRPRGAKNKPKPAGEEDKSARAQTPRKRPSARGGVPGNSDPSSMSPTTPSPPVPPLPLTFSTHPLLPYLLVGSQPSSLSGPMMAANSSSYSSSSAPPSPAQVDDFDLSSFLLPDLDDDPSSQGERF